jgi:hypothetical protein
VKGTLELAVIVVCCFLIVLFGVILWKAFGG